MPNKIKKISFETPPLFIVENRMYQKPALDGMREVLKAQRTVKNGRKKS